MANFRFGLMSRGAPDAKALRANARKAEDLGYYSVLLNDHYIGPGAAMTAANHPVQDMAPIPAAAAIAECTQGLVVGFRVLCVDYHNPVVLAKELATLDVLSSGRPEVGLGAGWIETEYAAMGVRYDRAGVRLGRLAETIDVLDQCFGGGPVDVQGKFGVHATGFSSVPQPAQRPRPPLAIGGGGPKVLALAARKADIVAFNLNNAAGKLGPQGPRSATAEQTAAKIDIVRSAAGERFGQLILEIGAYFTIVTNDAFGAARQLPTVTRGMFDLAPEDVLGHPHVLIGTVDEICDRLIERRERFGFSYVTIREADMEAFAPVVARLAGS
jgi:probable F420-dependent oxidoreductase